MCSVLCPNEMCSGLVFAERAWTPTLHMRRSEEFLLPFRTKSVAMTQCSNKKVADFLNRKDPQNFIGRYVSSRGHLVRLTLPPLPLLLARHSCCLRVAIGHHFAETYWDEKSYPRLVEKHVDLNWIQTQYLPGHSRCCHWTSEIVCHKIDYITCSHTIILHFSAISSMSSVAINGKHLLFTPSATGQITYNPKERVSVGC
jgi:hypothetical protein